MRSDIAFAPLDTVEGQRALWFTLRDLLGMPPVRGGAEIFPDEGLDHILNKVPKAGTAIQTTYYLGLFTTGTATTTPAGGGAGTRTDSLATAGTASEPGAGGYARVAIANTSWGALATSGNGRRTTTSTAITVGPSSGSWGTINGFFLGNQLATGAGSVAIFFANFDDASAVNVNAAGFSLSITPYFQIDQ